MGVSAQTPAWLQKRPYNGEIAPPISPPGIEGIAARDFPIAAGRGSMPR